MTTEEWSSGRELPADFMSSRETPARPVDETTSLSTELVQQQQQGSRLRVVVDVHRPLLKCQDNFSFHRTTSFAPVLQSS